MYRLVRILLLILPTATGISMICYLAAFVKRPAIRDEEQAALNQAQQIYFGDNGENIAWSWGSGPAVILVHGWGGRAAQLAPLAQYISTLGFRSISVEVTGHGNSRSRRTRWKYFFDDLAAIAAMLDGKVYAFVGHSAGALTMMAARTLKSIKATRYVCVCAPTHPYPAIDFLQQKLNPNPTAVEAYKQYIAADFCTTWEILRKGGSYTDDGAELLLCHDISDRVVNSSDGDTIKHVYPSAKLANTSGYGHLKILSSPELAQTIGVFLTHPKICPL